MPQVEQEYIETGKVRYIYRPLDDFSKDRSARLVAESLYCAGEEGKFWDMHNWLYANEERWSAAGDVVAALVNMAAPEIGLDGTRLQNCLGQERYSSRVLGFVDDANRRGISGTPTFLINDTLLSGFQSFETFSLYIEEALKP